MDFKLGENILCRRASGTAACDGKVVSVGDDEFVLEMGGAFFDQISKSKYVVVVGGDSEYHAEIISADGPLLRLKKIWPEKRGHFRVDDVFCVSARKVGRDAVSKECRLLPGYGTGLPDAEFSNETISPGLWKMLVDLNSKIELILQMLNVSCRDQCLETREVNLSESGMRFEIDEKLETGDIVEIKMLLPVCPPVGILIYGRVVRVNVSTDGKFEAALYFLDMEDDVRKEISKYTIKRQRTIIRKQKHQTRGAHRR
jgi:hypothetical protein